MHSLVPCMPGIPWLHVVHANNVSANAFAFPVVCSLSMRAFLHFRLGQRSTETEGFSDSGRIPIVPVDGLW
ncbi:hypothetical protein BDV34DRAFT_197423 [Aspergillus parasiticus]|uniref:Uncharacterized protein n=1 Tax=Aspergillus parasiticus TaxID=5067 RepID=A0A5N6DJT9_ASPPA|nr:hypothetical protein BDV34DRAFT_197423 [Aspergillus parasiticus]